MFLMWVGHLAWLKDENGPKELQNGDRIRCVDIKAGKRGA